MIEGSKFARLVAAASLLALIGACEEESAETTEEQPQMSTPAPGADADEIPAGESRTESERTGETYARLIRVPVTALTPGAAFIEAAIENPYSGDPEAIEAGGRHFAAYNCAGCHAPLGGGGMGPSLSDDDWIYGDEPGQVFLSIMHGRPAGMPAWSSMLTERIVWELAAFIETLDQVENYANKLGFDENVGGYRPQQDERDQQSEEQSEWKNSGRDQD